nr:hypothetical protein CFP56_00799 [Quercus suber]
MNWMSSKTRQEGLHGRPPTSTFRILTPDRLPASPTIILIHGAGDNCSDSWSSFISILHNRGHRLLLVDCEVHQGADIKPQLAVSELREYLDQNIANTGGPPYIFVAHSYGGCIARLYLQQHSTDVVGMVLAETGQETALSKDIEQEQYQTQIMGSRPLVVVRGNTLLAKLRSHEEAVNTAKSALEHEQLQQQGRMLEKWEEHDKMLKKEQLRLSSKHRYVSLPDCGHHVIRDRPEVIANQVDWVVEELLSMPLNLRQSAARPGNESWLRRLAHFVR